MEFFLGPLGGARGQTAGKSWLTRPFLLTEVNLTVPLIGVFCDAHALQWTLKVIVWKMGKQHHTLNNWWVKSQKHWLTSARNHSRWNIHRHVQPSSLSTSSVAEVLVHWWYSTGHPPFNRSFCTSACSLFFCTSLLSVSYRTKGLFLL